jgi:Rrf2 family iron-sulfur cluster assembly transcriptional regulator
MRIDLGRRGDYAVRAMLALASDEGPQPLSARRISAAMDIPVRFLPHVLADLARAGLVIGVTGRRGGYVLARRASAISLLEVIDAVRDEAEPARCILRGGPCDVAGRCAVHVPVAAATAAMRRELASASLAEVARRGGLPGAIAV